MGYEEPHTDSWLEAVQQLQHGVLGQEGTESDMEDTAQHKQHKGWLTLKFLHGKMEHTVDR